MSTILIRPKYELHSAAEEVYKVVRSNYTINNELVVGSVTSNGKKNKFISFFGYLSLLGPLLNVRTLVYSFTYFKKYDRIILDSSHYNWLVPILWLQQKKILIVYHNNEMIFLQKELKYLIKSKQIFELLFKTIKIPYTYLICTIENIFPCNFILLSTKDISGKKSDKIEFLDLTQPMIKELQLANANINLDKNLSFIGNNFYNNRVQILKILNDTKYHVYGYGSLQLKHPRYHYMGRYEKEEDLSNDNPFYLGNNTTGFPTKFLSYQRIKNSVVCTSSYHSLNIMDKPNVFDINFHSF